MSRVGVCERPHVARRSLWSGLVCLALSACGGTGAPGAASAEAASHPLVGAPAPAFELPDVSGRGDQSLEAFAGKVVIVDFWATWCEPCKQSFPAYQKLVTELGGDVVVVAISQDDDAKGIPAFLAETGAKFPVLWDDGKSVAKAYDPPTMPTAFVLDKSGIVRFVHKGYRVGDEATLEEEARSLLR
ncbi:MAG: ahpC/TSA family protein [Polyangiaceae bacterium]|nr:ahpC/TSA family protein [Polyangiaceae bacterium]